MSKVVWEEEYEEKCILVLNHIPSALDSFP